MTTTSLLCELRSSGIALSVSGGKLRVEAPKGVLTQELRDELALHKAEIIAALKASTPAPDKGGHDVVELAMREFKRIVRRLSRVMLPGYLAGAAQNQPELYGEIAQAYAAFDTAERVECLRAGRITLANYKKLMRAWGRLNVRAIKKHRRRVVCQAVKAIQNSFDLKGFDHGKNWTAYGQRGVPGGAEKVGGTSAFKN